MLDLQQEHTGMVGELEIAQRVKATVISLYPGRGANGKDEALIDAGAIAFSKDTGPSGGYGRVVGKPWQLARISQEHGILVKTQDNGPSLEIGETVDIIGQHACLTAAVSVVLVPMGEAEDSAGISVVLRGGQEHRLGRNSGRCVGAMERLVDEHVIV